MWRTAGWAIGLSLAIYAILSILNPVQTADRSIAQAIETTFQIHPINLMPAIVILGLSIWQIEVKRSMLISIAVASAIALFYQHYSLAELAKFITLGFRLEEDSPLQAILIGGGVLSMVKVSIVVILSTAFVEIFAGTQVLQRIERVLQRAHSRSDRFLVTTLVGIGSAAFGCTQAIAILLTQQLVEPKYKENEKGDYQLALDLENTVVVLAPLIPWNIAGLVPATVLDVDAGFIPFAVFLYLVPLLSFLQLKYPSRPVSLCN
jgi:NhaC family Na+:H+ antiporter